MSGSDCKIIDNSSGIHSLAGFAFQIKVFAYFALCITKVNEFVEFETLDDINVKITPKNIDKKVDSFACNAKYDDENNLIQVKRTKLTQDDFNKTLYNWLLQSNKNTAITKYILFSDKEYNNLDLMFNNTAEELYNNAITTKKEKYNAIEVQIKNKYNDNLKAFKKDYDYINQHYSFIGDKNIDDLIYEQAKFRLLYNDNNKPLYKERLEFFLNTIQNNILEYINKKEPYILGNDNIIKIYEDMNSAFNENTYWPPYYSFKGKFDYVTLEHSDISNLRETQQLLHCNLQPQNAIERIKKLLYYKHFRSLSMENGKTSKPVNIENTTYDNFQSVLEELTEASKDTPKTRLLETEKRDNNYSPNDDIRKGSCIYLTGENISNQISWKDDINANN